MYKNLFFIAIIFLLNSCVSVKNQKLDSEFSNYKKISTFDYCSNFSYIQNIDDLKYKRLFIEYISIKSDCKWNGLSRGYFVDLFRDNIKVNSFKLVSREDFSNLEISTYIIDEQYYIDIINSFGVLDDLLIIDFDGIYTDEILKSFGKRNIYLDKNRFFVEYNKSLVRMNFFKTYFSKDSANTFR